MTLEFTGTGRLELATPWGKAFGEIAIDGGLIDGPWSRAGDLWSCEREGWHLGVESGPGGALRLTVRNGLAEPRRLGEVLFGRWCPRAFETPLDSASFRELIHGSSFDQTGCGVKCVGRRTGRLEHVAPSSMFTVYHGESGGALLLGVVPPLGDALCWARTLHAEPHLEGSFGFELGHDFRCTLSPGQSVTTSWVMALSGAQGVAVLREYAAAWSPHARPARPTQVGWNSWDFYSGAVSRAATDENLAASRELLPGAVRVFAIDEGWEAQWGTWEPNTKFGCDLTDYCRTVRASGAMPGIWTAPLMVNTYNPLYLAHPEWFALNEEGQVRIDTYSYGPMAYLDPTIPEVIAHLGEVFAKIRSWGFEYYKVDFTQCILRASRFRDTSVPRGALIRGAFDAIRNAIGDKAYLLSCGAPYESVFGIADAVRTSGDIHIYWGHVLLNAGAFSARWWMQGSMCNCDPDFLVVRGPETAKPPYGKLVPVRPLGPDCGWMAGRQFTETEARAYALLVHLTGGDLFLGDALRLLEPRALRMIERVLTPRVPPAEPVDLFASDQELPRIWVSRGERDTLVGLFNWSDRPARLDFDARRYGLAGAARDFWTGSALGALPERQARRSSLGLLYTKV